MYVYECRNCGNRCWDTEDLEEKEGGLRYFCPYVRRRRAASS